MYTTKHTGATARFEQALTAHHTDDEGWIQADFRDLWVKAGGSALSTAHAVRSLERAGRLEIRKQGTGGKTSKIQAVRFLGEPPKTKVSTKEELLALLRRNANSKGRVYHTAHQLRKNLGVSPHDLMKLLFDLKEAGMLTFDQRGQGSSLNPTNIRLRPIAYLEQATIDEAQAQEPIAHETPPAPEPAWMGQEEITPVETPVERYPIIKSLVSGARNRLLIEQASKLLEQAGLEDEATKLLVEHDTLSPLEIEVVEFAKETKYFEGNK